MDVEFEQLYGSEERCREALFSWRWPEGSAYPACGGLAHLLEKRSLWQCNACRTQTSLTAVTIFAAARHHAFKAANTVLGNIKCAIAATFRSGSKKHAPRRLAEFEYQFNRRYDLPAMMPRLGWVAV